MRISTWKLNLNVKSLDAADRLFKHCTSLLETEPRGVLVDTYSKGGFMVCFSLEHSEQLSWPETVFEILALSQKIGQGWRVLGSISDNFCGVLSLDAGGTFSIPGVIWADWDVDKVS